MIFTSPIKSRVIKAIKEKIAKAEQEHSAKCIQIDEEAKRQKEANLNRLVDEIVGKFI